MKGQVKGATVFVGKMVPFTKKMGSLGGVLFDPLNIFDRKHSRDFFQDWRACFFSVRLCELHHNGVLESCTCHLLAKLPF